MKALNALEIATTPFMDQRPGTSGLRKRTRVFMQRHYLENYVQAVFDAVREQTGADLGRETLIVGGDGRFYNREAIQIILRIAAANGIGRILVGQKGILSTPAMSAAIRRRSALGGLVLSASHNPGGLEADFGVKYNISNGGPAPELLTGAVYRRTLELRRFLTLDAPDVDLGRLHTTGLAGSEITIVDPLEDYTALMESLFDFGALRALFRSGFRLIFDAMHGVTGPYARHIFVSLLGAPEESVMNGVPLEDFGGHHPDPNLVHAAGLVAKMSGEEAADLGAACDGDGDRNLILGRNLFVTPGDSLAILAEHAAACIPGYRSGLKGAARSMPTSTAVDRVAASLGIPCHETPTGWKYFGNLMDAGLCTFCGEESFGTGSDHIREKDGLWAVLAWLSIVAATGKPVDRLVHDHWERFGRSYFQRHDFEALDSAAAERMISESRQMLESMPGSAVGGARVVRTDEFSYRDPVDGSVTENQGSRIFLEDGSRIVWRLSGTGTQGATLRLYLERHRPGGSEPLEEIIGPLVAAAYGILRMEERFGRERPDVVT